MSSLTRRPAHGIDLAAPDGLARLFAHNRSIYGELRMDAGPRGRLAEIRTRQAEISATLDDIQLRSESGEPDEAERDQLALRSDALIQEGEELIEEAAPLQTRQDQIDSLRERMALERTSPVAPGEQGSDPGHQIPRSVQLRTQTDPWADLDGVRNGMVTPNVVRGRAAAAVEAFSRRSDNYGLSPEAAEEVTRKLEKLGPKFATSFSRQLLSTSSPEYLQAFESYLNDPTGYQSRAALSLTAANGGYLVPFTLDPTIILTNNGAVNPYRENATIKTTTTNDWNGVTSAGVTAEWTAEGIEAADATPTVGQLKITPQKADAYLFGSFEVLGDSDFAAQLPMLLADAKDRLDENAFAVGTGTGQPWGVIPRATTVAAASGTAATGPTADSVYTLMASLPARWRGPTANNVFLSNLTTINRLRNVPAFTGATTSIVDDSGPVPRLLGKPLLESTSIVGAFANGNKVLAYLDMKQYYIVDRVGMSVVYDPIVLGANRRPTGQGAWYAFWRTGADISVSTAARVLTLTT